MNKKWESFYSREVGNQFPHHSIICFYYRNFFKQNKKLYFLDLGAGSGSSLKLFQRKNINLDMVDISSSALKNIKKVKKFCNVRLHHSSFNEYLEKNNQYYDWVLDSTSLQHQSFDQIRYSYELIYNRLKKGGYFLTIHINKNKNMSDPSFLTTYLSKSKIIQLLTKNKFKTIDYNYFTYSENNSKKFIKFNVVIAKK
jgi:ubiquinone/menaquinone biosynthesis C-methylase UbiE